MSVLAKPLTVGSGRSVPSEDRGKIQWRNLSVGAFMNVFQVTSLGQPLEVMKTHVAAHRGDTLREAIRKTWSRGGFTAFYQGLIPWAWIEASTKGAILILASTEMERWSKSQFGVSPAVAGVLGGIFGGAAQSYLTMGRQTLIDVCQEANKHRRDDMYEDGRGYTQQNSSRWRQSRRDYGNIFPNSSNQGHSRRQ